MEILSAIIAAIKAVPMMVDLTNRFIDMWIQSQVNDAKDVMIAERKKLLYLKSKIREATSDEERIALSIILNDYNSGKM